MAFKNQSDKIWEFFSSRFTYEAGPVLTLIENYMIKKLLEIMEFPPDGDGVFCAGSSQANMYGLVMARQRHCPDIKINGFYQRSKLIAYTSEDVSLK